MHSAHHARGGLGQILGQIPGGLELLGRVTGELQSSGVTVLVAVEQQLGVTLDVAQKAVKLYQSTEGTTPEETDRLALEWLHGRGWRCLPPSAAAS